MMEPFVCVVGLWRPRDARHRAITKKDLILFIARKSKWLGRRRVSGGVDLVVLVVVGEAHWIGSMDIMGWGWG